MILNKLYFVEKEDHKLTRNAKNLAEKNLHKLQKELAKKVTANWSEKKVTPTEERAAAMKRLGNAKQEAMQAHRQKARAHIEEMRQLKARRDALKREIEEARRRKASSSHNQEGGSSSSPAENDTLPRRERTPRRLRPIEQNTPGDDKSQHGFKNNPLSDPDQIQDLHELQIRMDAFNEVYERAVLEAQKHGPTSDFWEKLTDKEKWKDLKIRNKHLDNMRMQYAVLEKLRKKLGIPQELIYMHANPSDLSPKVKSLVMKLKQVMEIIKAQLVKFNHQNNPHLTKVLSKLASMIAKLEKDGMPETYQDWADGWDFEKLLLS